MLGVKIDPFWVLQSLYDWMTTPSPARPLVTELTLTLDEVTADLFYGRD